MCQGIFGIREIAKFLHKVPIRAESTPASAFPARKECMILPNRANAAPFWPLGFRGAALIGVLFLAACRFEGTGEATTPRHVVIVVIDTLRADHLPLYGYARDTAPFLATLGAEGAVFDHAVSTSSYTAEAISSLFAGYYPSATPWGAGWHARPSLNHQTLALRFREAGYKTALFSESPMLDHPEYFRGFDHTECLKTFGVSGQAPNLVEKALEWLEANADEPTLLYLHILDPHAPYAPPPDQYKAFVTERPEAPVQMEEDLRVRLSHLKDEGFGPGEARFENLVQRYDAEIAFVDRAIEKFFDGMERLGTLGDTLAVITADHGEEFLDHGYVEHAWKLYPETFRVPMIFWRPGLIVPAREARTVSLVDVLPTLLHFQDLDADALLNGTTLFNKEDGVAQLAVNGEPRVMELLIQSRCLIRAVITEDALYLAYWKWLSPEDCERTANLPKENRMSFFEGSTQPTDPWGPIVREEYYELKSDPGCKRDLAATRPEALTRWRAHLEAYRETCPPQLPDRYKATKEPAALTPEQATLLVGIDPTYLAPPPGGMPDEETLRTLGYL